MNTRILIPLLLAGAVALACGSRSRADATMKPSDKRDRSGEEQRDQDARIHCQDTE